MKNTTIFETRLKLIIRGGIAKFRGHRHLVVKVIEAGIVV